MKKRLIILFIILWFSIWFINYSHNINWNIKSENWEMKLQKEEKSINYWLDKKNNSIINMQTNESKECIDKSEVSVYIYMYHYIRNKNWDKPNANFIQNAVITENFEAQMQEFQKLQSKGKIKIIFLSELEKLQTKNCLPHKNLVILTADDWRDDNYINLFPIVKKYNLKFHLSIISDFIKEDRYSNFMTKSELKEISNNSNFEVIWHTFQHLDLRNMSDYYLKREICQSKINLEQFTGKTINTLVYPAGKYNKSVIQKAKECWYKYALTTKGGVNAFSELLSSPFELNRIRVSRSSTVASLIEKYDFSIED